MQGVNLPAQNVIMRNGYLSTRNIGGDMPKLTNYEISNLRGRAGRLLKDFVGRTFVLDENAFVNQTEIQGDLFKDENKDLQSGYGKIFTSNKRTITDAVFNNKSNENLPNEIGKDGKFLITYIRFNILKHGMECLKRLDSVGIDFTSDDIKLIKYELEQELEVPTSICLKNRYIDPLVINDIYMNINSFIIPTNINENNLSHQFFKLVKQIKSKYPNYYSNYFDSELTESFFYTVTDWMKEKPLNKILSGNYFNDSNNIDSKINSIQKKICFDLTSMLKPFYSIKNSESNILSCIEMGGYKPLTLLLISLNIPREVALILSKTIFSKLDLNIESLDDAFVKTYIKENINNIDFWNRIQLQHLL